MYAVIRTGGKQYKVQAGDVLQVEKIDHPLGKEFDINEIVMIGGDATHVGKPLVQNAKVTVVITKIAKTQKVYVFKKKRRHGYRRFGTHRQNFTEIFVKSITAPDGKVTTTEEQPHVVDMVAKREEQIKAKQAAKRLRLESRGTEDAVEVKTQKVATSKKVHKKPAKKVAAKKTTKRSAKKTTKKTVKKTTKKA